MPAARFIAAIDPGLTGAVAFLDPQALERVSVFDMPVVGSEVDIASLARLLREHGPAFALVELVGPMPRDGSIQAFKFGAAYASAKATVSLTGICLHLATPAVWKKHFKIQGGPDGKEQARGLALRLFPASAASFARKKDHGRAEAALLARFALETGLM
ncbi:hypothetical protein [Bosea sp. BK604]|uniref:hypothetical protein n=1 Tax=Bosea sp. BK604 TaxID=2512180 RepID=UPI0010493B30|nr:hypothetical protein [Bosea sp. BK604]TCR64670.1 hypothetical protein EV560_106135 [Bosea sp. BK604]